jgi:yecA family protein
MSEHPTQQSKIDFSSAQAVMVTENIQSHASEIHGVLTGLVCAGFTFEDQNYMAMLNDLFTDGNVFPSTVKAIIKQMYSELWADILDDDYAFQLMVPDDEDSIVERGHALGKWVQGFNLGFGLQQKNNPITSNEVKEVLTDFSEIANLSDEMEEDEDTEQAYFEISEYVRISALLCFTELGSSPTTVDNKNTDNTIH